MATSLDFSQHNASQSAAVSAMSNVEEWRALLGALCMDEQFANDTNLVFFHAHRTFHLLDVELRHNSCGNQYHPPFSPTFTLQVLAVYCDLI
jgi:hypothetical protein